jgi:hypothetical protein
MIGGKVVLKTRSLPKTSATLYIFEQRTVLKIKEKKSVDIDDLAGKTLPDVFSENGQTPFKDLFFL